MKFSHATIFTTCATFFTVSYAWPAMASSAKDLTRRLAEINGERAARSMAKRSPQGEFEVPGHDETGDDDDDGTSVLIGDLAKVGPQTPVGTMLSNLLLKQESAQSIDDGYVPPGQPGSDACKQDTCCVWSHISQDLTPLFTEENGHCNDLARAAIRLGFHDAATWSAPLAASGQDFGGADGSIVLSGIELDRSENNGLQTIGQVLTEIRDKFPVVSMADLVQFASIHAVVTCPLGPRIRFFAGRKDSSTPALNGLLPNVHASADSLIQLFQDKTIVPHDLAALLGAHSTSRQFFTNTTAAGQSQDSTPGIWDVKYYKETLDSRSPDNVFRFPSDLVLSKHAKLSQEWNSFLLGDGQKHWNEDYAQSYTRLSLLGVGNLNDLVECSMVLPGAKTGIEGLMQRA